MSAATTDRALAQLLAGGSGLPTTEAHLEAAPGFDADEWARRMRQGEEEASPGVWGWLFIAVFMLLTIALLVYAGEASQVSTAGMVLLARDCSRRAPSAGVDVDLLLTSGALSGPFTRPHPVTLTWRKRLARAIRRALFARQPKVTQ